MHETTIRHLSSRDPQKFMRPRERENEGKKREREREKRWEERMCGRDALSLLRIEDRELQTLVHFVEKVQDD